MRSLVPSSGPLKLAKLTGAVSPSGRATRRQTQLVRSVWGTLVLKLPLTSTATSCGRLSPPLNWPLSKTQYRSTASPVVPLLVPEMVSIDPSSGLVCGSRKVGSLGTATCVVVIAACAEEAKARKQKTRMPSARRTIYLERNFTLRDCEAAVPPVGVKVTPSLVRSLWFFRSALRPLALSLTTTLRVPAAVTLTRVRPTFFALLSAARPGTPCAVRIASSSPG